MPWVSMSTGEVEEWGRAIFFPLSYFWIFFSPIPILVFSLATRVANVLKTVLRDLMLSGRPFFFTCGSTDYLPVFHSICVYPTFTT